MPARAIASLQGFVFVAVLAASLFGAAGRLDLTGFWIYIAIVAATSMVSLVITDPGLVEERVRPGGRNMNAIYALAMLWPIAHWVIAGLDRGRFHWSDGVPAWLRVIALAAFAASFAVVVWSAYANRFASTVLRIQEERGHKVASNGPYAFVRHPMYVAGVVIGATSGLALGSWLAEAVFAPFVPFLIWRTTKEDRLLQVDLPGYREYAERVRYRILPGVW
jgi:protein-S-isoprenylcysteine O-methyltransferase Ste14